jgi:hypothetical protein
MEESTFRPCRLMLARRFLLLLTLIAAVNLFGQSIAEAPRVYVDTTWNPPTGGRTWHAHTSADLQDALNSANPGDTIVLDAGSTYIGNFTLPAKAHPDNKWIYMESSGLSRLPAPGMRVSPSDASSMGQIVTPNGSPAINPLPGASHYRLVGLEVTTASNQGCQPQNNPPVNCFTYFLFGQMDGGLGHPTQLPDSITFDRVYMHGSPTQDVREGIQGNVTNLAVIDSYISDIHQSTADSQAIAVYFTPGPIKIVDNFLSASTEDVMFGGAGGYNNPYVPSDIEIRRNHFFKPLAWDSCGAGGTLSSSELQPNGVRCSAGVGYQWVEKNNLEFKSARRVVVTGNIFENTWVSAQVGYSVLFTVRTGQSGDIAVVDDITVENNLFTHVDAGFNTLEHDDGCKPPSYPHCTNPGEVKRIGIYNNLVLMTPSSNPHHIGLAIAMDMTDLVFQHNTVIMSDQSTCFNAIFFNVKQRVTWPLQQSSTHNVSILNNVLCRQPSGDWGGQGMAGLQSYMGDPSPLAPRFRGNLMFVASGDRVQAWSAQNGTTSSPFSFVDAAKNNYQLVPQKRTKDNDVQLSGVDMARLLAASGQEKSAPVGGEVKGKKDGDLGSR